MKNQRSTVAMQIAHKIAKRSDNVSFGDCLKHAWAIVKADMQAAIDILSNTYKITVKIKMVKGGVKRKIIFAKAGIKNAIKRLWQHGSTFDIATIG